MIKLILTDDREVIITRPSKAWAYEIKSWSRVDPHTYLSPSEVELLNQRIRPPLESA